MQLISINHAYICVINTKICIYLLNICCLKIFRLVENGEGTAMELGPWDVGNARFALVLA